MKKHNPDRCNADSGNKARHWRIICSFVIVFLLCAGLCPVTADTIAGSRDGSQVSDPAARAREIMDYVDDLWRGVSSRATMSMHVKTERWERTITMTGWSLEKDYSLVRILSPKKEAGTATLKFKSDIYNYLPKTDRTIKITSGMMMGSWMGSHFTNDDLVKESRLADDYDLTMAFDGIRDGTDIWEIELIPKPDAAVVWGRILFSVRKSDRMPLLSYYFDEAGKLVRTVTFSEYRTMGGRLVPARMKLVPEDEPGEFTELIYEDISFDLKLEPGFFSLQNLKKM